MTFIRHNAGMLCHISLILGETILYIESTILHSFKTRHGISQSFVATLERCYDELYLERSKTALKERRAAKTFQLESTACRGRTTCQPPHTAPDPAEAFHGAIGGRKRSEGASNACSESETRVPKEEDLQAWGYILLHRECLYCST